MIFPESELSTYLGFFVPGGQVEPLLDRIAEASSEFEELNLVGFLHLAQRELELTGDVNRDDAAVVLIEELQLPLADAAAVLEENPAATAARLQSAWAEVPDQHTGPMPNVLQDGLIMLEPGLELDDSLVLDPSLSIISPKPQPEPSQTVQAQDAPIAHRPAAMAVAPTEYEDAELVRPEDAVPGADEPEARGPAVSAHAAGEPAVAASEDPASPEPSDLAVRDQSEQAPDHPASAAPDAGLRDVMGAEAQRAEDSSMAYGRHEAEPEVVVEVFPAEAAAGEPELVVAQTALAEEAADVAERASVDVSAIEPEMVPGPAMVFADDAEDVYAPLPAASAETDDSSITPDADDLAGEQADAQPAVHNPYAALTPESLEGSSQSFPWNPNDHSQPVTAAALLDLEDDVVLTQGPSQPITHVTGRIPVAEILDGETEGIAAFPSHHVASDVAFPSVHDPEAEVLAGLLLDATARGDALVTVDAPAATPDDTTEHPQPVANDEDQAEEPGDLSAEPPLGVLDDEQGTGATPEGLTDTFGASAVPEPTPAVTTDGVPGDAWPTSDQPLAVGELAEAPLKAEADAVPDLDTAARDTADQQGAPGRKAITPYWMRGRAMMADSAAPAVAPEQDAEAEVLPGESTAQWGMEELAEASWADQPFPDYGAQHDGEDTQQLPAMDRIAAITEANEQAVIGANLAPDQVRSPSVERFLDDLHGAWIAGGNDVLQRPVSDVPLGGRVELADPPDPSAYSAPEPGSVPPPPRSKPVASGAELTNDEAVEATYEEEFVAEPPAPVPPPPAAVWIPGMADRAFRSTPWHHIDDAIETEDGGEPDLHGFGATTVTPARPVEVRQSPAEKIQEADVAAFMAAGPADAPEWDGVDEGIWAHADYGPKRPKANRAGQIGGLLALVLAAGVVYLYTSWPPFQAAITALGLPVHPLVVVGALAGVLGIGGLSMFIGSSIPKQPKVKVVRRRRRKRDDGDPSAESEHYLDEGAGVDDEIEVSIEDPVEELTDVWEEEGPAEN